MKFEGLLADDNTFMKVEKCQPPPPTPPEFLPR